ncbi:MAG: MMPL family transporter [Spirochaetes bacterium]|nr:MMPL family transporter [Spirochaetota bacterium]
MNSAFSSVVRRLLSFATRHPWPLIAATGAVTVLCAFFATRLEIDTDLSGLLPKDAEVTRLVEHYGGKVAETDVLVIAIRGPDLLRLDALGAFSDAIDAIAVMPGVTAVISPFSLPTFQRAADGRLQVVPLSEGRKAPRDEAGLAAFEARLSATRYARNLVVSPDGGLLACFVQVEAKRDPTPLLAEVRRAMDGIDLEGVTTHVTGTVAFAERTRLYLGRDAVRLLALAAAVILAFYWLGFRAARGVFLPLVVVLLGTLWSVGLMGLLGLKLTLVSIVAPPLILIFGNEYAIYVMNEYYRMGRETVPAAGHAWIDAAVAKVARPILMAFVTTMVGFLSLCVTDIRQTQEFAIVASFGSAACGLLALFFLPALLTLFPRPTEDRTRNLLEGPLSRLMTRTSALVTRRPWAVLAFLPVAAATFAVGLGMIEFNTDPATYFPPRDPVIRDMYVLTGEIGGFDEMHVTLEAPEGTRAYFLDPGVLRAVSELEAAVRADPDVCYSLSLPSFIADARYALDGTEGLPASRSVVLLFSRLVAAAAGGPEGIPLLGNLSDAGLGRLTLTFRIYNSDTGHFMDEQRFRSFIARFERAVAEHPVGEARPVVWGELLRNLSLADSLRRFLIISMAISMGIIFCISALTFRSLLRGLFAVLPLACGLMLNFAFMGFAHIPLDMTTIMVANITIGVGIDSAIYLVIEYRRQLRLRPGDFAGAIAATLQVMGRPVILSTASIAAGLLVLATAAFRPVVYFGLLVVFSLTVTAAGNLVLLPALLAVEHRLRSKARDG